VLDFSFNDQIQISGVLVDSIDVLAFTVSFELEEREVKLVEVINTLKYFKLFYDCLSLGGCQQAIFFDIMKVLIRVDNL